MELKINLADREEIAAAVALLQTILGASDKSAAQIFGGAAPLVPAAAPSIAAAAPLPTAPVVQPEVTSTATPNAPLPSVPAAPVTAAPSVSVAPVSAPASGVELDAKGLPWDERIHASTKSKIASGEWKAKRGVDAALVASVEAELRARMQPPPAGSGVPAAPAPFAPPAAPSVPAAPAAPSASADPTTFEQLMPRLTGAVISGAIPSTAVGEACQMHGLASVVALQTAPQFVPAVWATLKQQYPSLA